MTHQERLNFADASWLHIALVAYEKLLMEPFTISIEQRITRVLQRLDCNGIQVTHHGGGMITLTCTDRNANKSALAIAATKTVPGVTEVSFQNENS